jgi:hypothetical protein
MAGAIQKPQQAFYAARVHGQIQVVAIVVDFFVVVH